MSQWIDLDWTVEYETVDEDGDSVDASVDISLRVLLDKTDGQWEMSDYDITGPLDAPGITSHELRAKIENDLGDIEAQAIYVLEEDFDERI